MEYVLRQVTLEQLGIILALISSAVGLILNLFVQKRENRRARTEERNSAIDNLDQVRVALMEEINRLSARQDELKKENEDLRTEVKVLRAENRRLERRVCELEAELERLGHLKSNV